MEPMSNKEVIEEIRRAFAGTKRPDPRDFVHCEQCEIFLGRYLECCPETWEEIRSEDISYESSALTAVTPRGWQFLLPAYMVWHLQHYDQKTNSSTVDYLVYNLTWSEDKDDQSSRDSKAFRLNRCALLMLFWRSSQRRLMIPVSRRKRHRPESPTGRAQPPDMTLHSASR